MYRDTYLPRGREWDTFHSSFVLLSLFPRGVSQVVDTTGAGDAFSAGFLHVWKATGDVQAALRWGCALGSTVVTREGATCRLSVDEDIRPNLMPR